MAKRGVPDHPKTLKLARRLGVAPWAAVGLLECFWHWCAKYAMTGVIAADPEDIADGLRYGEDPAKLWEALIECGWVDLLPDGRHVVHDASQHADNTWKALLKRAGDCFWNESQPDHEAVEPEYQQNHNSITTPSQRSCEPPNHNHNHYHNHLPPSPQGDAEDSPPEAKKRARKEIPDTVKQEFVRFQATYPKRAGSQDWPEALTRFANRVIDDKIPPDSMIEGAARYAAYQSAVGKVGTEFVKTAASFLSPKHRFWEEDWSPPANGKSDGPDPYEGFQEGAA